jgi:hypothetical protein
MWRITTILDDMITIFPQKGQYAHKALPLNEAKRVFTPSTSHNLKEVTRSLLKKTRTSNAIEWAHVLGDIRSETKDVEPQLHQVDSLLRNFVRGHSAEEFEANKEARSMLVDARLELMLAFDLIWRLNRRLKQDKTEMFNVARRLEGRVGSRFVPRGRSTSRPFDAPPEERVESALTSIHR